MLYKLLFKRSINVYRRSYISILTIFIAAISILSFLQIYLNSCYNFNDAVTIPKLTAEYTCDIRVKNLPASEVHLYNDIDHIEMKYENGNLDIFILDESYAEEIKYQVAERFNSVIRENYDFSDDTLPHIRMYYFTNIDDIYESHGESVEPFITSFQITLTVFAIISMTQVYNNYIEERSSDIRTLVSIGINENTLSRFFGIECTVLYLISYFIGMIFGGVIAYLFFLPGKIFNLAESNIVFPVFKVNITSLLLTFIIGFLAVNIAFRFVLNKILKIDASYTCADTIVEFNPDKSRTLYYRRKGGFNKFFSTVLSKRSSKKIKILKFISTLLLLCSVFIVNLICLATADAIVTDRAFFKYETSTSISGYIANLSIYIVILVCTLFFASSLLSVINKQQVNSFSSSAVLMYTLGAKEEDIYNYLRSYIKKTTIWTLIISCVIGLAGSVYLTYILSVGTYFFRGLQLPNIFSYIGIAIIAAVYYAVSIKSLNNSYTEIIETKINGGN